MDIYPILSSIDHNHHNLIRYIKFISSCKSKNMDINGVYLEAHHICPKSLFPEYKSLKKNLWNKVLLTPRQHFIAHLILSKALPNKSTRSSIYFMSHIKRYESNMKANSKLYSEIRLDNYSKKKSKQTKQKLSAAAKNKVSAYDTINKINVKVSVEEFNKSDHLVGIVKYKNVNSYRRLKSDYKLNQSLAQIKSKQNKIQCEHCSKLSDKSNYVRWHGDNCKKKGSG